MIRSFFIEGPGTKSKKSDRMHALKIVKHSLTYLI